MYYVRRTRKCPSNVEADVFEEMKEKWQSPEWLAMSAKNKANRNCDNAKKSGQYCGGRVSTSTYRKRIVSVQLPVKLKIVLSYITFIFNYLIF